MPHESNTAASLLKGMYGGGKWHSFVDGVLEGHECALYAWTLRVSVVLLYTVTAVIAGLASYLFFKLESVDGWDCIHCFEALFVCVLTGHLMRWYRIEGLDPRFKRVVFALLTFIAVCNYANMGKLYPSVTGYFHLFGHTLTKPTAGPAHINAAHATAGPAPAVLNLVAGSSH